MGRFASNLFGTILGVQPVCQLPTEPFLRASRFHSICGGVRINATPSPQYLQNCGLHFRIIFPTQGKTNIFVIEFYIPQDQRSLYGFFG